MNWNKGCKVTHRSGRVTKTEETDQPIDAFLMADWFVRLSASAQVTVATKGCYEVSPARLSDGRIWLSDQ